MNAIPHLSALNVLSDLNTKLSNSRCIALENLDLKLMNTKLPNSVYVILETVELNYPYRYILSFIYKIKHKINDNKIL